MDIYEYINCLSYFDMDKFDTGLKSRYNLPENFQLNKLLSRLKARYTSTDIYILYMTIAENTDELTLTSYLREVLNGVSVEERLNNVISSVELFILFESKDWGVSDFTKAELNIFSSLNYNTVEDIMSDFKSYGSGFFLLSNRSKFSDATLHHIRLKSFFDLLNNLIIPYIKENPSNISSDYEYLSEFCRDRMLLYGCNNSADVLNLYDRLSNNLFKMNENWLPTERIVELLDKIIIPELNGRYWRLKNVCA